MDQHPRLPLDFLHAVKVHGYSFQAKLDAVLVL